ncbi:hypothetical protein RRG08_049913 [Elysia crispata]|uniref:Uncharacterized protein n=1 Tax=Elysia crispata TaxID=231223 RepID=A0AAE1CPT4_9GAST|nr:hypothetical protein RRG08_049913 [Elysia crispata]
MPWPGPARGLVAKLDMIMYHYSLNSNSILYSSDELAPTNHLWKEAAHNTYNIGSIRAQKGMEEEVSFDPSLLSPDMQKTKVFDFGAFCDTAAVVKALGPEEFLPSEFEMFFRSNLVLAIVPNNAIIETASSSSVTPTFPAPVDRDWLADDINSGSCLLPLETAQRPELRPREALFPKTAFISYRSDNPFLFLGLSEALIGKA